MSIDHAERYRERFPILSETNYLISNSLGAVPREVEHSLGEYYRVWAERGVRAWEETWWTLAAETGDLVAPLIGAGKGEVVFLPSVTIAHAGLFSCFEHRYGPRKIVTDALHFPSILYLIGERRRDGAEVVVVPSEDGIGIDAGRIAEAIDAETSFVAISHVLFRSSFIQDVKTIARRTREVGAALIVDGYQAVGSIPVDVHELGVDAYIGGCLKWLCGGPGAAFAWIAPERRSQWRPRLTGWMSHVHPFAFEAEWHPRDDAWRFLNGTPNIPALYAVRPGLQVIGEVGVQEIRARSIRQTRRLIETAWDLGYRVNAPREDERRAGTTAIDLPHGAEVSRALKARGILCDFRPGAGVRLSPHFYNTDEEIDAAIQAIKEILSSGVWTEYVTDSVVT